jgi:hypothetical protein
MRSPRVLSIAAAFLVAVSITAPPAYAGNSRWDAAWGAAAQPAAPTVDWYGVNWSQEGFADDSLRQVIRLGDGGAKVRIRLSNVYGTTPLRVAGATVAAAGAGAAVRPGSLRTLRFGGSAGTVIPPGREIVSDATALRTSALERLTVTVRLNAPTGPATFHHFAMATSYRAKGDHLTDTRATASTQRSDSWYYLTGVEVSGHPHQGTVVAFGDSLTDGVGSTKNADARYPDRLAERLVSAGRSLSVANAGIGGNRVLSDSPVYGERALSRFTRDVLERPGVRSVIVLEGVNDLAAWNETGPVTARQVIDGYRALIRLAHSRGIKVIVAPSEQVIEALARALRLSGAERAHLFRLGGLQPPGPDSVPAYLTPSVQRVLDRMTSTPVAVFDATWTLLLANPPYAALMGDPAGAATSATRCGATSSA